MLEKKNIIVGISGGIAAYKSASLIRLLIGKGAEVQVVITPSGKEFITPVTLSALSGRPVVGEFFTANDGTWHSHVDLGLWADAMLIAPATAASIGKMANGIADNMLVTTYLAMKAPVFVAPAMDLDMYAHPSTQRNLATLLSYGNRIIGPASGFLASRLEGKGRMEEPERIVDVVEQFFRRRNDLTGKNVLITAGPTRERIDPVRFVSNYSSGKMGYALAEACADRGAGVVLISGPVERTTNRPQIQTVRVESAEEMYDACMKYFPAMDAAICCAAVADYRPRQKYDAKIKRNNDEWLIPMVANKDIAAAMGKMKTAAQTLAGFALETDNERAHAADKLKTKNLDFIVLNSLREEGAGFQTDTNKITLLDRDGAQTDFPLKPKTEAAEDIIDELIRKMKRK
jgi:phosphopantothenoylcysteine decarboxylase/phosphopantothenate--cysteine ligase